MKKFASAALVCAMTLSISCSSDEKEKSQTELLTNGSTKSWKITFDSSDEQEEDPSCRVGSAKNVDNKFILHADGSFRFDNGDIIEIEDCEDCCSDIVDAVGNWSISDNGNHFKITATGRIDDDVVTPFDEEFVLFDSELIRLTEGELVLEQDGVTVKFNPF